MPRSEKRPERPSGSNLLCVGVTALLFAVMLLLCYLYIDLRLTDGHYRQLPPAIRWQITGSVGDHAEAAESLVRPNIVGVKREDEPLRLSAFNNASYASYELSFAEAFGALAGAEAEVTRFASENDARQAADRVTGAKRYAVAVYADGLPSEALAAGLFSEENAVLPPFEVRTAYLLPDENGLLAAVCFDADGDTLTIGGTNVPYDRFYPAAYTVDKGGVNGGAAAGSPFVYTMNSVSAPRVILSPSASLVTDDPGDAVTVGLLGAFSLNPNIAKSFHSSYDDSVSFVENGRELYVSGTRGTVTLSAKENGVPLSAVLKYYPSGDTYTFSDKLRAVRALLHQLDRRLVGGDSALVLSYIGRGNGELSLGLKYQYNGVLLTDRSADAVVTFSGDAVTAFELYAVNMTPTDGAVPVLPGGLFTDGSDVLCGMYEYDENDTAVGIVWAKRSGAMEN